MAHVALFQAVVQLRQNKIACGLHKRRLRVQRALFELANAVRERDSKGGAIANRRIEKRSQHGTAMCARRVETPEIKGGEIVETRLRRNLQANACR